MEIFDPFIRLNFCFAYDWYHSKDFIHCPFIIRRTHYVNKTFTQLDSVILLHTNNKDKKQSVFYLCTTDLLLTPLHNWFTHVFEGWCSSTYDDFYWEDIILQKMHTAEGGGMIMYNVLLLYIGQWNSCTYKICVSLWICKPITQL